MELARAKAQAAARDATQKLKKDLQKLLYAAPTSITSTCHRSGVLRSTYHYWLNKPGRSPQLSSLVPLVNTIGYRVCVLVLRTEVASDFAIVPWLLERLKERGITSLEVQWRLGIAPSTLDNWRIQRRSPRVELLLLILGHLGYKMTFRKNEELDANNPTQRNLRRPATAA